MTGFHHEPVLLQQVVDALAPADGELFVDCTLGGGGHTRALLAAADCRVIGIDRDPAALAACADLGDRVTPVRGRFSDLGRILTDLIRGEATEITQLPTVNHRSPLWEPEPLRWMGIRFAQEGFARLDKKAAATGQAPTGTTLVERIGRH